MKYMKAPITQIPAPLGQVEREPGRLAPERAGLKSAKGVLLTLAATAAGLSVLSWLQDGYPFVEDRNGKQYGWNPLVFDSDAFRLAVQLDLALVPYPADIAALHNASGRSWAEMRGADTYEAARRAIVRAAAALGAEKTPNGASTQITDIFTNNHASNVSAQTDQPRLVFVCSAGMLRSATGAKTFAARGCNTRSCGTHDFALIPLSANLIAWADRLYFAHEENWHKAQAVFAAKGNLLAMLQEKSQVCQIPDIYDYDAPELHAIWASQVVLPDRKIILSHLDQQQ